MKKSAGAKAGRPGVYFSRSRARSFAVSISVPPEPVTPLLEKIVSGAAAELPRVKKSL